MDEWQAASLSGFPELAIGSRQSAQGAVAGFDSCVQSAKRRENMTWTMRIPRAALVTATLAGAFFSFPPASLAAARIDSVSASATAENPAADAAAARLNKAQYRNVKVSVEQGIATLTGSVDIYEYKADAEKRVRKAKGVTAVRNLIEVAAPPISDKDLQAKLAEDLAYDRVGWGDAAFNSITVGVNHGVVTLGGHARTDVDKDSALALVATTRGVKDVLDEIEVAFLSKYAVDPIKPIRISVQNGHVELYGLVDTQADKNAAFIRANGVSGVFSVKNYIQVAGQPAETQK